MTSVVPLILAGGAGTRLWPLSRELFPKQFHAIFGERSLLQNTLLRARAVSETPAIIVCNEDHRFLVAEQCRGIDLGWTSLILEPEGRNTAPAIGLAALRALEDDENAVLLFLPSDHLVADEAAFAAAAQEAIEAAKKGRLVTFGVQPTRPETGYGYIEVDQICSSAQPVVSFVEKPSAEVAEQYLAGGRHLWNSGMFVLGARAYMDELAKRRPAIAEAVEAAYASGEKDLDFFRPGEAFLSAPSESIDYAVMEETDKAAVVAVQFGWNDVGSWSAIWDESERDADGNHLDGDVVAVDTKDSYVLAQNRLVSTIGVQDLIVVETSDAVLITSKDRVQDVKAVVTRLKADDRDEYVCHSEVFRPWGSYETVENGARYQVKRIKVKPGASLSLQMHHHRSEHWIVVHGTAEVVCGERTEMLSENEGIYIPIGAQHRLTNPGKLMLELIEVQVGSYLGEDDIVRFDDVYGRSN